MLRAKRRAFQIVSPALMRLHKILRRDFAVLAEHLFQHLHHAVSRWDGARNDTCARSGPLPFSIKKPYFAVVSISASL